MAKRTVDEAKVVLSADAKELVRGLNTATGHISKFARLALGAAGVTGVVRAFKDFAQQADDLRNTARKIGQTTTALQELRFAGEEFGVATNTTDMALQRFTRRLGEAANGGGELKGILDQYNISVRDAEGNTRDTNDVLDDLADAIAGASFEQEQLRIAFKAFDSEGAALVNMLRDGSEGLDEMRQKARDLGVVIGEETINELAEMNREIEILIQKAKTFGTESAGHFVQGLNTFAVLFGGAEPKTVAQAERLVNHLEDRLADWQERLMNSSDPATDFEMSELNSRIEMLSLAQDKLDKLRKTESAAKNTGGGPTATDEEQKKREQRATTFAGILAQLETRTQGVISSIMDLQGVSASEIELSMQSLQIENQLKKQGIELNDEERAQLNQALDLLEQKIDKQEDLSREMEHTKQASEEWTNALNQGLADAIFRAKSFGDILDALLKRLLNSALFGLDGRGGLLGGITTSIGGAIGGIFGGIFGRASGGYVSPGVPIMVGEQGPEPFIPSSPGKIMTAAQGKGMMGGQPVTVNNHFHFDGTYNPSHRAMVQNEINEATPILVAATAKALQRGT